MNKSFAFESPFFLYLKKHFCPSCGKLMEIKKEKRILTSESPDAKEFDFSVGDSFLSGEVEFNYNVFYCDFCKRTYSIKEIRQYERNLKKRLLK